MGGKTTKLRFGILPESQGELGGARCLIHLIPWLRGPAYVFVQS